MYEEKELMWQKERKELQQTIELLKKELQTMRELGMFQKDKCEKQNTPSDDQVMEYHTDEEELKRDRMDTEEKQEEKMEYHTGNVVTETGGQN
jgi:hypothetical protein